MEALDLDRSKQFPIRVRRGQSIDQTIQVKNLDGTAFDFTGYSAELLAYTSFAKTDLTPEFEIDVELAIGSMRFTSSPINRKKEAFVYILWMTDDAGLRQPWTNGDFIVLNRPWSASDEELTLTISPEGSPIVFYISPIGLTDDPGEVPDPITSQAIADALGYVPANNATLATHIANTSNPHSVTATQVGLGNFAAILALMTAQDKIDLTAAIIQNIRDTINEA